MAVYKTKYMPNHPKASASGCVYEHVLIAEKAVGRYLPDGAEVHHVDENKQNNVGSNLVICQDRAFHKLLHVRAKILRMGGHPRIHAFCAVCKTIKSISEFNSSSSSKGMGVQPQCRDCQKPITPITRRRAATKCPSNCPL